MAHLRSYLAVIAVYVSWAAAQDLSTITALAAAAKRTEIAKRQTVSPLPLTRYTFPYSALPYQVYPSGVPGASQVGYNICNSTTEGPNSLCQTMMMNSLADFCLWGPIASNVDVNSNGFQGSAVAFCSLAGHGTRIMPPGTITGAQFIKTSAYIQVTGYFNQSGIDLNPAITTGVSELDPHAKTNFGNPIGGLLYSNSLPSATDNSTLLQAPSWDSIVGTGYFCIKLCDPTISSPNYCLNTWGLWGCPYNMPSANVDNEFTSCEGDLQDAPGTYTSGGQTLTWSLPAVYPSISALPWNPRVPASSNCITHSSAELFGSATVATAATGSKGSSTSTSTSSGSAIGGHHSSVIGPAVGGAVGGIVVLGALILAILWCCRRDRRQHGGEIDPDPVPTSSYTPWSAQNTYAPQHNTAPVMSNVAPGALGAYAGQSNTRQSPQEADIRHYSPTRFEPYSPTSNTDPFRDRSTVASSSVSPTSTGGFGRQAAVAAAAAMANSSPSAGSPPSTPASPTFMGSQLTSEQLATVQHLYRLNVPPAEIAAVMERMKLEGPTSTNGASGSTPVHRDSHALETAAPPSYDFMDK